MKSILLVEPGVFRATELPEASKPGPGEALIRVHRVGVCGTDLHAFRGKQPFFSYPRILGHELGVEVLAVGEGVTSIAVGDRCAVEPYLNCGRCIACRRGKPNCCTQLKVMGVHVDGGLRERFLVPAAKLHARFPTISSRWSRRSASAPTRSIERRWQRAKLSQSSAQDQLDFPSSNLPSLLKRASSQSISTPAVSRFVANDWVWPPMRRLTRPPRPTSPHVSPNSSAEIYRRRFSTPLATRLPWPRPSTIPRTAVA